MKFKSNKLILIVLVILVVLVRFLIRISINRRSKDTSVLGNIIGKDIYSENGNLLGKVKEVYVKDYKIYGWLIEPNKKIVKKIVKKIKNKKILIKHEHIKSIGEVMIIKEEFAEYLENVIPEDI
ncbi:MAG: PRC-barrel domain-containing protein [archaeon]